MAYATATSTARFDFAARIQSVAAGAAEAIKQYNEYRTTYRELMQLGDRELDDLGLSRAMLRETAMKTVYGK